MKFVMLTAALAATATVATAIPECANSEAIRLAAREGDGLRCATLTGFQFLEPVYPNTPFDLFCVTPSCLSTWTKLSELVTEDCVYAGLNIKTIVHEKLKGVCDPPAIPPCANADAINKVLSSASVGRCAIQTGFSFMVPVANNASLTDFCSNANCAVSGDLINLMPEQCLINGFNMKKEVLDKLEGRCNAPEVPRCENQDYIIRAGTQGIGGRCLMDTGIVLVQPVPDNAAFDLFCSHPQCQSALSRVSDLVTNECLVNGVLMKKDVLDKVAVGCATPPKPDCPSN